MWSGNYKTNRFIVAFKKNNILFIIALVLAIINFSHSLMPLAKWFSNLQDIVGQNLFITFSIVYIVALLETIFIISFYFPGSVIIVVVIGIFGFSLSGLLACIIIYFAFLSGAFLCYIMGCYFQDFVVKFGHNKLIDRAKEILEKYGLWAVFLMSFHPNYFGTLFIAAGVLKVESYRLFYCLTISLLISISFWAILLISTQDYLFEISNIGSQDKWYLLPLLLFIIAVLNTIRLYWRKTIS